MLWNASELNRSSTVRTSSWWTGGKRLVSALSIDWIGWARSIFRLDFTCKMSNDSNDCPRYLAAELFQSYCRISWARR